MIAAARDRKIVVAGHVPIAIPASDVIESGQRSLEHVSPALVGDAGVLFACSSREAELRTELLAYRGALATEGTLEAGKRADLVLLDANPLSDIRSIRRVHAVVRDGKLLDRAALDVLLDQARTAARQ